MRIALCCKDGMIGDAIGSLLSHKGGFTVVGSSPDIRSCVGVAKDGGADVIVVHDEALDRQAIDFLNGAKAYGDFHTVLIANGKSAKGLGAVGFDKRLHLSGSSDDLFTTLREYQDTSRPFRSRSVREGRRRYGTYHLTKREHDVATLVGKGMSNRTIAESSGLQEQSVKNLVSVIMRKLNCENRVQVALKLSGTKQTA